MMDFPEDLNVSHFNPPGQGYKAMDKEEEEIPKKDQDEKEKK